MRMWQSSISSYHFYSLFFFVLFLGLIDNAHSQISDSADLFKELVKADSLLFEEGFNNCELSTLKNIIHDDLQFYHDTSGEENRAEFLQSFERNICSNPDHKPIRTLVRGSLAVFELKNEGKIYGAIQKGKHRFYIKEPNKDPFYTTSAKFTHIWVLENEQWKLKTSLSYDHKK